MLSQSALLGSSCSLQPSGIFLACALIFLALALYCGVLLLSFAAVPKMVRKKEGRKSILLLHALIFLYALTRALTALRWAGRLPSLGLEAGISLACVSYFLLFFSFTRLIMLWAGTYHYTMQPHKQAKMHCVGHLTTLSMFVLLFIIAILLSLNIRNPSATNGFLYFSTVLVAILSLTTGTAFAVYAYRLGAMLEMKRIIQYDAFQSKEKHKMGGHLLQKLRKRLSTCYTQLFPVDPKKHGRGLPLRFRRAGVVVSFAFVCLSILWIVSLLIVGAPTEQVWSGFSALLIISFVLEVVACMGLLFLFAHSARNIYFQERKKLSESRRSGQQASSEIPKSSLAAPSMDRQSNESEGEPVGLEMTSTAHEQELLN